MSGANSEAGGAEGVEIRRANPRRPQRLARAFRRWRWAPLVVPALAVGLPLAALILRGSLLGDRLIVDQRLSQPVPGVMADALPGTRIEVRGGPTALALPTGGRHPEVQLRLSSTARSCILHVTRLSPHPASHLVWPQDGEYFDLGPAPGANETQLYRVSALPWEKTWGLAPGQARASNLIDVRTANAGAPFDYRVIAARPVSPLETLARLTFFLRISRIALAATLLGLVALAAAVWALQRRRIHLAAVAAITGLSLLFVALTPPFEAADETAHMGTIEYFVAGGGHGMPSYWPASMSMATLATDLELVRFRPERPLPLLSPAARQQAEETLRLPATREAYLNGGSYFAFTTQAATEAPLFYPFFTVLPAEVLRLPLIERCFLYRLLVSLMGLSLSLLGIAALWLAGERSETVLGLLLVLFIPEWIGVVCSTNPYSPGLGAAALASCLIVGSLSLRRAMAAVWLATAAVLAAAGGLVLRECLALAAVAGGVLAARVLFSSRQATAEERPARRRHTIDWLILLAVLAVPVGIILINRGLPPNFRILEGQLGQAAFLTGTLPRWTPVILAPFALAWMLVAAERAARRRDHKRALRLLRIGPLLALLAFVAASRLIFPDARVPTSAWVAGMTPELFVRRVVKAWGLTALAWDQDFIAWKTFFGALGWQDMLFPPFVYAAARWICDGLLVAIPALFIRAAATDRRRARRSLALVAAALSLILLATVMRSSVALLHGRFVLFAGPLLGLALADQCRSRAATWVLRLFVVLLAVLGLLTLFYFMPLRYVFAAGGNVIGLLP
jgi:hypothetical protein